MVPHSKILHRLFPLFHTFSTPDLDYLPAIEGRAMMECSWSHHSHQYRRHSPTLSSLQLPLFLRQEASPFRLVFSPTRRVILFVTTSTVQVSVRRNSSSSTETDVQQSRLNTSCQAVHCGCTVSNGKTIFLKTLLTCND